MALQPGGKRAYRYPAWQLEEGGTLPGLKNILAILERHDPWMRLQFFLREHPRLGGKRPLDVLREKRGAEMDRVLDAAKTYGEHGAD